MTLWSEKLLFVLGDAGWFPELDTVLQKRKKKKKKFSQVSEVTIGERGMSEMSELYHTNTKNLECFLS